MIGFLYVQNGHHIVSTGLRVYGLDFRRRRTGPERPGSRSEKKSDQFNVSKISYLQRWRAEILRLSERVKRAFEPESKFVRLTGKGLPVSCAYQLIMS